MPCHVHYNNVRQHLVRGDRRVSVVPPLVPAAAAPQHRARPGRHASHVWQCSILYGEISTVKSILLKAPLAFNDMQIHLNCQKGIYSGTFCKKQVLVSKLWCHYVSSTPMSKDCQTSLTSLDQGEEHFLEVFDDHLIHNENLERLFFDHKDPY